MPKLDNETLTLIFVAITAIALSLQAIILLAIFLAIRKAAQSLKEEVDNLRSSVMPLIHDSRELFFRITPKVESTVEDLAVISRGLRMQTAEMQTSAAEIMERVRRQSSRLDLMFSGVLDAVDRAGGFVADAVSKPVRQIRGLLASIKAVIESLRASESAPRPNHSSDDQDIFP